METSPESVTGISPCTEGYHTTYLWTVTAACLHVVLYGTPLKNKK